MEPFFKIFGQLVSGLLSEMSLVCLWPQCQKGLNPLDVILEDVGIEASEFCAVRRRANQVAHNLARHARFIF